MASNLTTHGAGLAMAAVAGSFWLGLGIGQSPAGLVGEAAGGGYGRVAVTVGATGATATNGAAVTFTGFTVTQGAFTHGGLFDAPAGGNCVWVGPLNAAVNISAGVPVTIQPGDLDLAIEVAA
jgi:hypothetical protein